ncbi:hypothetical protein EVAR_87788_1 [Eumeta japonica]|uniref:Uncharacterized protein n=1 Tax=Eumeta variegata TaxID=151549 RepID=A0A4C1X4Y6_EUMVA|nr:hypothetical protein EVAR_87788_1 [Eumeta japonica]
MSADLCEVADEACGDACAILTSDNHHHHKLSGLKLASAVTCRGRAPGGALTSAIGATPAAIPMCFHVLSDNSPVNKPVNHNRLPGASAAAGRCAGARRGRVRDPDARPYPEKAYDRVKINDLCTILSMHRVNSELIVLLSYPSISYLRDIKDNTCPTNEW